MRYLFNFVIGLLLCFCCPLSALAEDIDEIIEATLKKAVVKISVSSKISIIEGGVNLCSSEGTGFLIGPEFVVTAEHVHKLDPRCGESFIVARSRRTNFETLATVVGAQNDVSMLKLDMPAKGDMCSLPVMPTDIYSSKALRIGIPGGYNDPSVFYVKVGDRNSEFRPLVPVTPVATAPGESGGPVIYNLNVVGIMRSRDAAHSAFALMTLASNIKMLSTKYKVKVATTFCNPTSYYLYNSGSQDVGAVINLGVSGGNRSLIKDFSSILGKSQSMASATIDVRGEGNKIVISSQSGDKIPTETRNKKENLEKIRAANKVAVDSATEDTIEIIGRSLWDDFVDSATRKGKWKD